MNTTPDSHDLIVIGASSGGVSALKTLVSQLPEDFPAAVMIVLHMAPTPTLALLAGLLDDAGPLPAAYPEDGETIRSSRIYVAPQDHHLIVRRSHLHLTRTPKENWTRPAINPLFRSAAGSFGRRVAAVVLTGMLDDGTAGLLAVETAGGATVVQDPGNAEFPDMPLSALEYLDPDHIVLLSELPALLVQLAGTPVAGAAQSLTAETDAGSDVTQDTVDGIPDEARETGNASGFTCPECNGALWQVREHGFSENLCRIGHRFSPDPLLEAQGLNCENQLQAALRSLREEAELARRLFERGRERWVDPKRQQRHRRRIDELQRQGDQLERLLRDTPEPAVNTEQT